MATGNGTASSALAPFNDGVSVPSAGISIPQVIPMFSDAACEVHHEHFSGSAERRVKDLKSISNYWTGPA